jgi:hypothetical protein
MFPPIHNICFQFDKFFIAAVFACCTPAGVFAVQPSLEILVTITGTNDEIYSEGGTEGGRLSDSDPGFQKKLHLSVAALSPVLSVRRSSFRLQPSNWQLPQSDANCIFDRLQKERTSKSVDLDTSPLPIFSNCLKPAHASF